MKSNFIVSVYRKNWIEGARRLFLAEPYVHHVLEKNGELKNYDEVKIAPYFRANREELIRDHNFVDQKYHKYIPILSRRLNQIHGTNYDEYFWKKSLSLALIRYITLFYDLFQVCEDCFDIEAHECRTLSEKSYHIPKDFDEHRDLFQTTAYGQEQIFSIYIALFYSGRFESNDDEFVWPTIPGVEGVSNTSFVKRVVRKLYCATLARILERVANKFYALQSPRMVVIESFFSSEHLNDLVKKSKGLIQSIHLNCNFNFESEVSWEKRNAISQISSDFDRFDQFFFSSLKHCLSKVFLEEFAQVTGYYDQFFKQFKKLKYVVNESWIGGNYPSIAMAIAQRQGLAHIYNEHNYLTHHFLCNHHKYLMPLVDKFVTLGWVQAAIPNLIKGSSLREWVAAGNHTKEHEILFISGQPAVKVPEFNAAYGDFGAFNAQSHLKFDREFFQELSLSTIQTIVYRGYPVDGFVVAHVKPPMYAYDQEFVLKDYMKKFKLVDNVSRSGKALMQKSKLVIVDYLSTSYIESMLANIPTIFFWNQENYPLNDKQADFYSLLIDAGICQTNPKNGAQFVESIKCNPEEWWQKQSVQNAKNIFLSQNFGATRELKDYLVKLSTSETC